MTKLKGTDTNGYSHLRPQKGKNFKKELNSVYGKTVTSLTDMELLKYNVKLALAEVKIFKVSDGYEAAVQEGMEIAYEKVLQIINEVQNNDN